MRLEGLHHVTAITADAARNLDFYAETLGLRLVKKTVNFDKPDAYHLYFADEDASPGAVMTFFEFPGATAGRAGAGMVHRILWRIGAPAALDFWADRLGVARREERFLRFADPEGLDHELHVVDVPDPPLVAASAEVPTAHALRGLHGVRAYAREPARSRGLLSDVLGFAGGGGEWAVVGAQRRAAYVYDPPPDTDGVGGAGTVHHVAWHATDSEHEAWRARIADAGYRPTPVLDRQYFRSIYFREPSGVLFELATTSPGFAVDEAADRLGSGLRLPPQHEHLRGRLEEILTPLADPRA